MGIALFSHLLPIARKQALLDADDRIKALLEDRWIDYPRATEALIELERLIETPPRERMPCFFFLGDSNIGKTKITSKLRRAHPNEFDETRGVESCSIVAMQIPPTPDQHRFYSGLLFALGAPHSASAGTSALERLSRDILLGSAGWIMFPPLDQSTIGRLSAVGRVDVTQLQEMQTPAEWIEPRRQMPYCYACLALNHADICLRTTSWAGRCLAF